jgi:hypothetical protein
MIHEGNEGHVFQTPYGLTQPRATATRQELHANSAIPARMVLRDGAVDEQRQLRGLRVCLGVWGTALSVACAEGIGITGREEGWRRGRCARGF